MWAGLKINIIIIAVVSFILGILIGLHLNYKVDPWSGERFVPVDPATFKEFINTRGTADMVAIYFQYNSLDSLVVPQSEWILSTNEMKSTQFSIALGSRYYMVEIFKGAFYMTFYVTSFDFKT